LRKLLFTVVMIMALLLAAEVGVTLLSQHGMERALRSQYELPESLEVSINSFPYLASLARNHISELQLAWEGDLRYQAVEGALASMAYTGNVNLYDVELNMPSLLTGKLEVREVSREKAAISIATPDLGVALGLSPGALASDDGKLFVSDGEKKTQYMVKVSGDNALTLQPFTGYMDSRDSGQNPDGGAYTLVFHALPLDAELLNATIEGGDVVLEMSIPEWEGYL